MVTSANPIHCCTGIALVALSLAPSLAAGASVTVHVDPAQIQPGQTATLTVRVTSAEPVFGYTLRLKPVAHPGATGWLALRADAANWGGDQALIGPDLRDPTFSEIKMVGDDLVVSANTSDASAVTPVAGSGDVLVQATIESSNDASGTWQLECVRPTSVLSDTEFEAIPASWNVATLDVVPTMTPPFVCGFLGAASSLCTLALLSSAAILRRLA